MTQPFVSLVITTKNEEKNIGNCLESIRWQTHPQNLLEVIVVDNGSTDQTKQISRKYTAKVFDKGPERSAQRNYGMRMARGKYLMYLDADMILSPTVIEKAVRKMEEENFAGLYVPEVILGKSYWSRVRRFERSFYDGTVIDCVRVVRKDIFERAGGFDLQMTGPEDWDLDKKVRKLGKVEVVDTYDFTKLNNRLVDFGYHETNFAKCLAKISSSALIYHNEAKFNLKKYFQKKGYYAKSFAIYINKWGKDDSDIKKQFGFWYRYFWVFLENGKWRKLISFPELVLGMFFLRFLVGVSYFILVKTKS